jgi:copper chaperone CopZ
MAVKIQVSGMTCPNCARHVREALEAVPGVSSAVVELETGQAILEGDFDLQTALAAVEEEGYGARAA